MGGRVMCCHVDVWCSLVLYFCEFWGLGWVRLDVVGGEGGWDG